MALPVPSTPLLVPDFSLTRGSKKIDPRTKSSKDFPTVYIEDNACDVPAYKVFSISANINELTENCDNVQAATISISGRLPVGAAAIDFNTLLAAVEDDLRSAIVSLVVV